jgi:hypothetical protein
VGASERGSYFSVLNLPPLGLARFSLNPSSLFISPSRKSAKRECACEWE